MLKKERATDLEVRRVALLLEPLFVSGIQNHPVLLSPFAKSRFGGVLVVESESRTVGRRIGIAFRCLERFQRDVLEGGRESDPYLSARERSSDASSVNPEFPPSHCSSSTGIGNLQNNNYIISYSKLFVKGFERK